MSHFGDMAFQSAMDERYRTKKRGWGGGNEKTGKEMRWRIAETRKRKQQYNTENNRSAQL